MSNKDQNSNSSWRDRLDDLDNLPEEFIPVTNRSWEKLHDRLKEKPKRRKTYWYWAAACLFITILLPWTLQKKKDDIFVQQPQSSQQQPVLVNTGKVEQVKKIIDKIPADQIPQQKKDIRASFITVKDLPAKPNEPIPAPIEMTATNPLVNIVINNATTDTSKPNIAIITPKKKLRVVHINELYGADQFQLITNQNGNDKFRRFVKQAGKDFSLGSSPAAKYGVDHILIRNINSQN